MTGRRRGPMWVWASTPTTAWPSGSAAASSLPYRSARQPTATTASTAPESLSAAASRRVSTESFLAASTNPQVLTSTASASAGSATRSNPSASSRAASSSESTSLRAQPRLTIATLRRVPDTLAVTPPLCRAGVASGSDVRLPGASPTPVVAADRQRWSGLGVRRHALTGLLARNAHRPERPAFDAQRHLAAVGCHHPQRRLASELLRGALGDHPVEEDLLEAVAHDDPGVGRPDAHFDVCGHRAGDRRVAGTWRAEAGRRPGRRRQPAGLRTTVGEELRE